ncbi:MAG: DNA-protecting protein DprA [Ignavibacteriales bacterium]|nr:DNA-protecting protein DprA [Ignavibacteriales bacterium]
MTTEQITENAKAILLLCGRFGSGNDDAAKPLTTKEYDQLAAWLRTKNWWPVDLLEESNLMTLQDPALPVKRERLEALLSRGTAMALAVEKWSNKGLWVICRSDDDYPQRLKQNLRGNAPPILYGAGDRMLLSKGGLAVVGSRNVDSQGESFARNLGRHAAECGMQLVSGAARGVDEVAMHSAFSAGGTVVGVLADSLLSSAVSGKYREGLRDEKLTLVSTFIPEAGFSVGNAMSRNKYVYALADYAVVVSADHKKGGTWAGAEEELRNKDRRPVFVRIGTDVPRGNTELLKKGALPFPEEAWKEDLGGVLRTSSADVRPAIEEEKYLSLDFSQAQPSVAKSPDVSHTVHEGIQEYSLQKAQSATVYDAVRPIILAALRKPMTSDELRAILDVRKPQLQDWIKTLKAEGLVKTKTFHKKKKLMRIDPNEELGL